MAFCFRKQLISLRLAPHLQPPHSMVQLKCLAGTRHLTIAAPQVPHEHNFFEYTSGRWLYNEGKRLAERHLTFNIRALLQAAASSLDQQQSDIKSIRKMSEGGFNRVFELTMRNGLQVIARLPYPSTQPRLLATASEVATMDLTREHGVPTPKVYGYSACAENSVGSEYIIMEKVPGRCLGEVWYALSSQERTRVLEEIVDQEAKLFSIPLPAYGSVYNTVDLPSKMGRVEFQNRSRRFCVGPDVSLRHWFLTRSQLDIPRSHATTPLEVLERGARKELAWLHAYGKPRMPFDREFREMFNNAKVDPGEHVDNLHMFLKAAAYAVPHEAWLNKPVIRHPDLNPNNIFVDDELNITGIIDWQHTTILPLFLHAGIPKSIQNYGDPDSEELKKPEWPSNLDELDEDDRAKDVELYRRRHTHYYYAAVTATKLCSHYKAFSDTKVIFRQKLYTHSSEPWEGNSIPLKYDLVLLAREWSEIVSQGPEGDPAPCPISFGKEEADETLDKILQQEELSNTMNILREAIGISTDGWVSYERYDSALAEANAMKVKTLEYAENDLERQMVDQNWPFQDFDEDT